MLSTARRELNCKSGPIGSTRVRHVLKDFCFDGNISDVDDEVTKVFARNYC
jgi:hypothetical protein